MLGVGHLPEAMPVGRCLSSASAQPDWRSGCVTLTKDTWGHATWGSSSDTLSTDVTAYAGSAEHRMKTVDKSSLQGKVAAANGVEPVR